MSAGICNGTLPFPDFMKHPRTEARFKDQMNLKEQRVYSWMDVDMLDSLSI
jgi:hypothetical protein